MYLRSFLGLANQLTAFVLNLALMMRLKTTPQKRASLGLDSRNAASFQKVKTPASDRMEAHNFNQNLSTSAKITQSDMSYQRDIEEIASLGGMLNPSCS